MGYLYLFIVSDEVSVTYRRYKGPLIQRPFLHGPQKSVVTKFYCIMLTRVYSRSASGGMVKHYHIRKTDAGQFFLSDSHPFDTLPELVVYHKHHASG